MNPRRSTPTPARRIQRLAQALKKLAEEHEDQASAWTDGGDAENGEYHARLAAIARRGLRWASPSIDRELGGGRVMATRGEHIDQLIRRANAIYCSRCCAVLDPYHGEEYECPGCDHAIEDENDWIGAEEHDRRARAIERQWNDLSLTADTKGSE